MDLRPADGPETEMAWRVAMERNDGPAFLALSRQKVPVLQREGSAAAAGGGTLLASADGLRRGGYVLAEASGGAPRAILMASGTEVGLALDARTRLEAEGVPTRVVSVPSWFLFGQQDAEYHEAVLPRAVTARVSVEAASTFGWSRWVGEKGRSVGLDHFGASAPAEVLFEKLGITVDAVVAAAREIL